MNIRLPTNFYYSTSEGRNYAYVTENILFIVGSINLDDLMYNIAYRLYGYTKCYYCGVRLTENTRTIDHLYPRNWGGVSIPDNLVPSCRNCNSCKTNMTESQYNKFISLPDSYKSKYYQECVKSNTQVLKSKDFVLPEEWVVQYDASYLINNMDFEEIESAKYERLKEHYRIYKQFPHPIVLSSNDWLLKGKHILRFAKSIHVSVVPAIILDNVVVIKNEP